MSVYSACDNQGTAWEVLKFATSEEQDGKLLEMTGQMPMRADLESVYSDYFAQNPEYKTFADQASRMVEVPNVENSVEIWQTFRDAYSEAGATVAEFWRTMYDEGLSQQEAYNGDAFADQKSAMSIVGPWAIAVYGEAVDWGAAPVPTSAGTAPEDTYTFSDAKNIGLYSACENQGTAWELLKFATSEEQDGKLLEMTGQMPLRQDLTGTYPEYFEKNPDYEAFADQAARTVEVPNVPNSIEIWQTFRDEYSESVIFGKKTVDEALSAAAEEISTLASES